MPGHKTKSNRVVFRAATRAGKESRKAKRRLVFAGTRLVREYESASRGAPSGRDGDA